MSSLSAISDPCVGALSYRHRHPPPTNNSSKIKDGYDEISKLIFFISSYRHPPPTNNSTTCCVRVSGFQKFNDRYDETSKFIICSSSPIAIAILLPQMTLKLMLLACFCQRWNMEYLNRRFLHLLPQTTQFVPAF